MKKTIPWLFLILGIIFSTTIWNYIILPYDAANTINGQYSLNKINQSLRNKGIDNKYIKQSIDKIKEDEIEPDFVSALKLCKRRRIGPLRPGANRELFYKKDMGILARGGFSFELSKRVLDLEPVEFQKLIKII